MYFVAPVACAFSRSRLEIVHPSACIASQYLAQLAFRSPRALPLVRWKDPGYPWLGWYGQCKFNSYILLLLRRLLAPPAE